MRNTYFEITDPKYIDAAVRWLYTRGVECNYEYLTNNIKYALDNSDRTYVYINSVNEVGLVGKDSEATLHASTEIKLSYQKVYEVSSVSRNRVTVEIEGENYYLDEVRDALAGCEVVL